MFFFQDSRHSPIRGIRVEKGEMQAITSLPVFQELPERAVYRKIIEQAKIATSLAAPG